jgi:hypothetical protein
LEKGDAGGAFVETTTEIFVEVSEEDTADVTLEDEDLGFGRLYDFLFSTEFLTDKMTSGRGLKDDDGR